MKYTKFFIALLATVAGLTSCMDNSIPQSEIDEQELIDYMNYNNIRATRDAYGFYYTIVDSGKGQVLVDTSVVTLKLNMKVIKDTFKLDTTYVRALNMYSNSIRIGVAKIRLGGTINLYVPGYLSNNNSQELAFTCSPTEYFASQKIADDTIINRYLVKHALTAQKDDASGIYYSISVPGSTVKPNATSNVTVKYVGKMTNDVIFDQTTENNTLTFSLQNVIPGWRIATLMLGEGGKGRFYIPSRLAYGVSGNNAIAPNTVLIFDIELVTVK